ncbi:hypothetical protein GGS21DRAFT_154903 [Xylaria nigripes]|nr:hypothetical protein GGS21DRAFT_154903 [Xylaria nigripes]
MTTSVTDDFAPNWRPYLAPEGGFLPDAVFAVNCGICGKKLVLMGEEEGKDRNDFEICTILPCGHALGHDCARTWIENATGDASCPFCRFKLVHLLCGHRFLPWLIGPTFLRNIAESGGDGMPIVCWDCWAGGGGLADEQFPDRRGRRRAISIVADAMFGNMAYADSNRSERPAAALAESFTEESPLFPRVEDTPRATQEYFRPIVEEVLSANRVVLNLPEEDREWVTLYLTSRIQWSGNCGCEHCQQLRRHLYDATSDEAGEDDDDEMEMNYDLEGWMEIIDDEEEDSSDGEIDWVDV